MSMSKLQAIAIAIVVITGCAVAWSLVKDGAPPRVQCTLEAKLCPDGSAVGRTGPNCEFAECPTTYPLPATECTKDSDCPSPQYVCQETQGYGTACPSTDPTCIPTHTVIQGECKLKEGSRCDADSDCAAGNLCNRNTCTSPIGRQCSGPNDTSCPVDFECVQGCGPPVARENDPPPPYFCQLKGYMRPCPICLAKHTLIDTPQGAIPVEDLEKGMPVWTISASGKRVSGIVVKTSKTPVPPNHNMVELVLSDRRTLLVSPGHPTIDGRIVGDLVAGDVYDSARVVSANRVPYHDGFTYDILPALIYPEQSRGSRVEGVKPNGISGDTGFYFANGILMGSTLRL